MNKRILIGTACMLVGGALVVIGLLKIPIVPVVLILIGGALGFSGYKIYETRRSDKPQDLVYGGFKKK